MDPHCVWALRNEGTARHALQPCGCDVPCQRPSPPRANQPRARKPPHAHACGTGPRARRITRPCRSRERCQVEAEDRAGSSGRGRSSGSWTRRGTGPHPLLPAASRPDALRRGPVLLAGFVSNDRCGAAPEWTRTGRAFTGFPFNPSLHMDEAMEPRRTHLTRRLPGASRRLTARSRQRKGPFRGLVVSQLFDGKAAAAAQPTPVGPSST